MGKEELIKHLSLESFNPKRVYKKFLVWIIVLDIRNDKALEEKLQNSYFGTDKVKFEVTSAKEVREQVLKRINYFKDSHNLKANGENGNHGSNGNNNVNWRKRSSENEDNFSGKRIKKHSKADSNFSNQYGSNNSTSSTNNYNFKRKRFNSDGFSNNVIENPYKQNTKVTMSNQIKYRYSIREMFEIYSSSMSLFKEKPLFGSDIGELISSTKRVKISLFDELDSKRDRANTINYQAYEFKNKFGQEGKRSINLPKNNPLQNIDNFDFNSNNHSQTTTGHKYSGKKYENSYISNYNSNGTYKNKFDFAN